MRADLFWGKGLDKFWGGPKVMKSEGNVTSGTGERIVPKFPRFPGLGFINVGSASIHLDGSRIFFAASEN